MLKTDFRPDAVEEVETEWSRRRKVSRTASFVFGPIAVRDIKIATKLGGSCLAVLLAIFFRSNVTKARSVTLPGRLLDEFGIDTDAKLRALKRLEQAGLISVERRPGHSAIIKLRAKKRRARK
jgi:DNA-binding MarR family transcriptional regulator